MFERLSSDAKAAIVAAHREASAADAAEVGTAHLLLGILADPVSSGAAVLADLGVRAGDLRDQLSGRVGPASGLDDDDHDALAAIGIDLDEVRARLGGLFDDLESPAERRPDPSPGRSRAGRRMSQHCRGAVAAAIRHAVEHRSRRIGSDQLLLGIVDDPDCTGAELLARRGLRPADVHDAVRARRRAA